MEAPEKQIVAFEAEEFPEALVGRQGAQETRIALGSLDLELGSSHLDIGHETKQTQVLSPIATGVGELVTQRVDHGRRFPSAAMLLRTLGQQPLSDFLKFDDLLFQLHH